MQETQSVELRSMSPEYLVKSIFDLQAEYRHLQTQDDSSTLDLSCWLSELKNRLRPLIPGELAVIMADTGVGKTAILQNIALCARSLEILLFELELPGTLTFERFMAISNSMAQWKVEEQYKNQGFVRTGPADHIFTCDRSGISVQDMTDIIAAEAEHNHRHYELILVDYIGLIRSSRAGSRYEQVSRVAEDLKVMAKNTNTIVIAASQIHRKGYQEADGIGLHDAKDSGSIENSAGLILAASRTPDKPHKIQLGILKSTKGGASSDLIECDFKGSTLEITEGQPEYE